MRYLIRAKLATKWPGGPLLFYSDPVTGPEISQNVRVAGTYDLLRRVLETVTNGLVLA